LLQPLLLCRLHTWLDVWVVLHALPERLQVVRSSIRSSTVEAIAVDGGPAASTAGSTATFLAASYQQQAHGIANCCARNPDQLRTSVLLSAATLLLLRAQHNVKAPLLPQLVFLQPAMRLQLLHAANAACCVCKAQGCSC
jgi:hypothetical protein